MTVDRSENIDTAAVLVVSDLERSVAWYREALGFASGYDPKTDTTRFAIVERGGGALMLKQADRAGRPNRELTPGLGLFDAYVWVADIEAVERLLHRSGTPVVEGPVERPYGCVEIVVEDPDGFHICFGECR